MKLHKLYFFGHGRVIFILTSRDTTASVPCDPSPGARVPWAAYFRGHGQPHIFASDMPTSPTSLNMNSCWYSMRNCVERLTSTKSV